MRDTMRAAVFKGEGKLVIEDRPVPKVMAPDDVLLAVKGVGVCGTDLHILEVPPRMPATKDIIMGHEFCGEVVEVGSGVTGTVVGDRCAVDQNAPCGHCAECRSGFPNACLAVHSAPLPGFADTPGIFHDGALAKYIVVQDYMLYPVSDSIPWHHLAITETVACAVNAVKKASAELGDTIVVLGAGPVGLLITSMLKQSGARIISSEPADQRRNMAEKVGADVTVNPTDQDLLEVVNSETNGRGADVIVEAVGPLFDESIRLARFGGRIVLFGHDELARPAVPQAQIMRKELQVVGVWLAKYTFVPAIKLLERGLLPMDDVVSHVMPLNRILEAHDMMRSGQALKIVIDPTA